MIFRQFEMVREQRRVFIARFCQHLLQRFGDEMMQTFALLLHQRVVCRILHERMFEPIRGFDLL